MTPKKRKRSNTVRSLAQTSGAAIESHSVDMVGQYRGLSRTCEHLKALASLQRQCEVKHLNATK